MAKIKILTLMLAMTICACTNNNDQDPSSTEVIRIGVLPDQSNSKLSAQYAPLVDYLKTATSLSIELSIPSSYEELIGEFDAGRLHVANFGGFTFIQAEQKNGARPLVMRDIDLRFTSCYLVKASDTRRSVEDFEGEAFSFGPKLSTSGHLMPRHFLSLSGVVPERFFASIRHSSGHDETADWVSNGTVPIGVANCGIVRSMLKDGRLSKDKLSILETTPPYVDYVWATQEFLDASVTNRLRDAFLALDWTNPMHRPLLQALGGNGYLPAGRDDFNFIRIAAHAAGIFDTEQPR